MAGEFEGKNVLIFGLGHFGGQIEAARFFARRGARVVATDLKPKEKLAEALRALEQERITWRLGGHREEDFLGADLVVVSPAVPTTSPFLEFVRARRIPWTTELNLTVSRLKAPIVAVTGSNGKSTTTALLGAVLEEAGFETYVGGNIGRSLLHLASDIPATAFAVLEISSFQLEGLEAAGGIRPRAAVVLNITPNHLDRHGTIERYAEAKRCLVARQGEDGAAILNREDERVLAFREFTRARIFTFGFGNRFEGPGAFLRNGEIALRDEQGNEEAILDSRALRLPGRHNLANALAACAAAAALSLDRRALSRALERFEGIPHRLETVRERNGVRYVNDSKATTPEAAAAGLEACEQPLVLIAGGSDKGADYFPLARTAALRAETVLLIGATRERLKEEIARARGGAPRPEIALCATLEEAVSRAEALSRPGTTVLFSPACASYDMFSSFEERGERFRAVVRSLP